MDDVVDAEENLNDEQKDKYRDIFVNNIRILHMK